jgi:hypothetical protein
VVTELTWQLYAARVPRSFMNMHHVKTISRGISLINLKILALAWSSPHSIICGEDHIRARIFKFIREILHKMVFTCCVFVND